jgi:hypothetical protein
MKQNESKVDRIIRVVGGIVVLFLGFSGALSGGLAVVAYILGAILVFTGALGFCPIYAALKLSTLKK